MRKVDKNNLLFAISPVNPAFCGEPKGEGAKRGSPESISSASLQILALHDPIAHGNPNQNAADRRFRLRNYSRVIAAGVNATRPSRAMHSKLPMSGSKSARLESG
jgi:hypothetical protein